MDTWRGHFPITHFVHQALIKKKGAGAETLEFSSAENVLFNVCEFWAAVAKHELIPYLSTRPVPRLLLAFEAFSEVGAVRVASALRMALSECPEAPPPTWLHQKVIDLEARLLDTEDAIDNLIARFATEHLTIDSSERKQPMATSMPRSTGPRN